MACVCIWAGCPEESQALLRPGGEAAQVFWAILPGCGVEHVFNILP